MRFFRERRKSRPISDPQAHTDTDVPDSAETTGDSVTENAAHDASARPRRAVARAGENDHATDAPLGTTGSNDAAAAHVEQQSASSDTPHQIADPAPISETAVADSGLRRRSRPLASRPLAAVPEAASDPTQDDATEATPRRRRIWDLEDSTAGPVEPKKPAAPEPKRPRALSGIPDISAEHVAQARSIIEQMSQSGSDTVLPGDRTKTRVLGFRAAELAAEDPFTQDASIGNARGPDFPVGWIVVISGPGQGASYSLTSGVASIGRGTDQTISLNFGDNTISRQNHASIAYDVETRQFFLGHGSKSNIVRLNDRPVLSTEDLAHGDQVRIGETTLLFTALCGPTFDWTGPDSGEATNAAAE